jgi:hypothetical protein
VPEEQLYDLLFDTDEADNLAEDPSRGGVLAEMRERLEAWMRETDDPLLKGPVMPPEGAMINQPNQVSPDDPLTIIRGPRADPTAAPST